MLAIEKQVCNFTHAVALHHAGVRETSSFYWTHDMRLVSHAQAAFLPNGSKTYAAYMIAEMGNMLPETILSEFSFRIIKSKLEWVAYYKSHQSLYQSIYESASRRLADAIARVLLCLAKDGHLNLGVQAA